MKFSILIPVYNVEKYLEQCFESVINQSYTDFEVVVVDDGSTDSSKEICDDFAKMYPEKVTVIHKKNEGLISARRTAIEKARGEFCVFVDSDDYVENNLLETIDRYSSKEENIDIVIYSFSYFNQSSIKKQRKWSYDSTVWSDDRKKELYEALITSDIIDALWIKAIKTELLKRDPIDYRKYYGKNMSEDVLQSLYPLLYARKVIYADASLYNYRYNNASIARNFNVETISKKNSSHVFEEIIKSIPIWAPEDDEITNKVCARWFSDVMYIFWKSCECAGSKKDWQNIFDAAWTDMLPPYDIRGYQEYVNKHYLQLYYNYINNKRFSIKAQAFKKRIYNSIKGIKKTIKR